MTSSLPDPQPKPAAKSNRGCWIAVILILLGIFLLLGLIFLAILIPTLDKLNKQDAAPTSPPPVTQQAPQDTSAVAALTPDKAMEILFAGIPQRDGLVRKRAVFDEGEAEQDAFVEYDSLLSFRQNNQDKYYVIYKTMPADMRFEDGGYPHVTAAMLGVAILSPSQGGFQVEAREDDLGYVGGGYGEVPKAALIDIAPDTYGLGFENFNMGMGYESGSFTLIGLFQNQLVRLVDIPKLTNNSGTGDEEAKYGYETQLAFDFNQTKNGFYLIKVKRSGTCREESGQIVAVPEEEIIYYFDPEAEGYQTELGEDPVTEVCTG